MKREHVGWVVAAVALVLLLGGGTWTLPSVEAITPWWLRPRLVDGHRVQELRTHLRSALARHAGTRSRVRLAWASSLRRVDPVPRPGPLVKPPRADCPECRGSGRVRTGDGISWTDCDACLPPPRDEPAEPAPAAPPPKPAAAPPVAVTAPPAAPVVTHTGPVYMRECTPGGCRMVRIR